MQILKFREKYQNYYFSKVFPENFRIFNKPEYMRKNTCLYICVGTKFKAGMLQKHISFAVLNAQKATFYAIYEDFVDFHFFPIWFVQKVSKGLFLRS